MTTVDDGRREYQRRYGKTNQTRFEAMDDTPMNRGKLTAAARRGDAAARRKLREWKQTNERGGVQLDGPPPEPADVRFGNAD
ncbi:hypothetical protein [Nocardiopsis sp. L17-MgMaSL7]|uniref:hypothetical protein n=1 Tax=Nocardiopsis sp. L17-MgMaSL7 TaxID=1938893 RepID=UPI000D70FE69|nr:hypothetical protein [Nocardiopsis sp. L17-MgMaSL7]PWV49220.1 hypothetical protein BDW27_10974 [Nocardiopsis sp. L17-MgMaSL7]